MRKKKSPYILIIIRKGYYLDMPELFNKSYDGEMSKDGLSGRIQKRWKTSASLTCVPKKKKCHDKEIYMLRKQAGEGGSIMNKREIISLG